MTTQPSLSCTALEQTALEQLARDCAVAAMAGDCFALHGDLGVGKSTFARAFIRQRAGDFEQAFEVPSPTFTLVQSYPLSPMIHHYDLYRIAHEAELEELGFIESLDATICLIEWPERAGSTLGNDVIEVQISECSDPDQRNVEMRGPQAAIERLERSFRIRALLDDAGWSKADRMPLNADASARGYEHIERCGQPRVLMDAPRMPDGPVVYDGKPYSQIAHLAEDVTAFVAIATILQEHGFRAPQIDAFDLDDGLVLLEHLGRDGILDSQGRPIGKRYCDAARCLAHLHQVNWPAKINVTDNKAHVVPAFDLAAFQVEAGLMLDWYVPRMSGNKPGAAARAAYRGLIEDLHAALDHDHPSLIIRDFHSPNIIWCDGDTPVQQTGLIDFQDALLGPSAYDVVSLADDARVDIEPALRQRIIEAYCDEASRLNSEFDRVRFDHDAAIMSAQRAAKILGIFVRLDERDGKPAYLAHIPRVRRTLRNALSHPALQPMRLWLDEQGVVLDG